MSCASRARSIAYCHTAGCVGSSHGCPFLSSHGLPSARRFIAHSSFRPASSGSFATTMRAIGYMLFARNESNSAAMRRFDMGRLVSAPICCASGTRDLYSTRPRSSFTSITSALTSVRFAMSINFHMLLPSAAQRFTYNPRSVSGCATYATGVGTVSGRSTESFATPASCVRVADADAEADAEADAPVVADCAGSPQAASDASANPAIKPIPVRAFNERTAPRRRSASTPEDSRHLVLRVQHGIHFLSDRHRLFRNLRNAVV